jgi:drug/metabolite transporter (DMT)-like permease
VLGEALALLAALTWSVSVILFRRSEAVPPLAMNLFKNVTATVLLAITLLATGDHVDWQRPADDWLRLAASGVLGIAIADTMVFVALRRLGPGLLAIVDCAYAPIVLGLSVLFLDEPVGLGLVAGAGLVAFGVMLGTGGGAALPEAEGAARARLVGVLVGVLGITSMGVGVVLAKPVLARGSLIEITLIRLVAGVAAQLAWMAVVPSARAALRVFVPSRTWRTLVPAAFLSSYVALLFWLGGFKWAPASVAAVLNQMASVFTLLLARLLLGERLSRRKAVGAATAVAGALVVLLS